MYGTAERRNQARLACAVGRVARLTVAEIDTLADRHHVLRDRRTCFRIRTFRLRKKDCGRAFKLVIDVAVKATVKHSDIGTRPADRRAAKHRDPKRHRRDVGARIFVLPLNGGVDFG